MSRVPSLIAAVVGCIAIAAYLTLPNDVAAYAYPVFNVVLVAAILWRVGLGQIKHGRGPWLLFASGIGLWAAGDILSSFIGQSDPGGVTPFPSAADAVYLAAYPVIAFAISWASRCRGPRRDVVASLDGVMVAVAAAIPVWVLWISPAIREFEPSGAALVTAVIYPVVDLLLLACGTRYVLGGGRWNPANTLMVVGLLINIVSDVAFNGSALSGAYRQPDPLEIGFLITSVMWIVATLRPEASNLLEGGHRVQGVSYRARTWALVAIVALPLSVVAVSYVQGDPVDGRLVIGAFGLICAAMVLRLRLIARAGSTAWRGPALLSAAALVVVVAAVGLTSLQQATADAEQTADQMTEAIIIAERLDGIAGRAASTDPNEALRARESWGEAIAALRGHLADLGPAASDAERRVLSLQLDQYEAALGRQLALVDGGLTFVASEIGSRDVAAAHDAFLGGAWDSVAEYRDLAHASAQSSRVSTVLSLALSLLLLTLLLVRFGGVGRRAQLAHQALHDSLTGLPNRALIEERLRHAFSRSRRDLTLQGLVMLDLDDFKTVNDTLGHPIGDELLRGVGERLGGCVRSGDTLARIGGDGFAILLEQIDGPEAATATAQRMLAALEAPFEIAGTTHLTHASAGVAVSDGAGAGTSTERAATMLRDAELAMYAAKDREGNSFEVFTVDMHDAVAQRLELKAELARAIKQEEFTLAYQPIVDIAAQEVVGYEALVRWIHPERGFVSPADFIPVAEQTGLIVELGTWVLREACRQMAEWAPGWPDHRYVSVNVAGHQLQREDFADVVAAALDDTGLGPCALLLEVTESSLIHDIAGSQRRMQSVRDLGVRFAIDDFGTGYSSLSYLNRFPLDVLKIDKSFTDEITTGPRGRAIVDAIVNMAASLDLAVVAEGIEEPEQMQVLAEMGCGLGQGYFYARPLPPVDVPGFEVGPSLRLVKAS